MRREAPRPPRRRWPGSSAACGQAKEYGYGYDAQTGKYGDLVALGIIDPTKIVRTALEDAASIVGLIVTTEATITEHPKKEAPALTQGGGMGGMDY